MVEIQTFHRSLAKTWFSENNPKIHVVTKVAKFYQQLRWPEPSQEPCEE
jgi:hypothetical protein